MADVSSHDSTQISSPTRRRDPKARRIVKRRPIVNRLLTTADEAEEIREHRTGRRSKRYDDPARPANDAIVAINSDGGTGLDTWIWYPHISAFVLSSERAK